MRHNGASRNYIVAEPPEGPPASILRPGRVAPASQACSIHAPLTLRYQISAVSALVPVHAQSIDTGQAAPAHTSRPAVLGPLPLPQRLRSGRLRDSASTTSATTAAAKAAPMAARRLPAHETGCQITRHAAVRMCYARCSPRDCSAGQITYHDNMSTRPMAHPVLPRPPAGFFTHIATCATPCALQPQQAPRPAKHRTLRQPARG